MWSNVESPIFVTGCKRSGTTMVARAIKLCGAFDLNFVDEEGNEILDPKYKIMFDNKVIYEELVKPYFLEMGADPTGQYPLPDKVVIPTDWKEKVLDILFSYGYTEDKKWMLKDNTMGLIWRVWDYAFPNAKWVIVRRRTGDIADSCLKTGYMKAFSDFEICKKVGAKNSREGWVWWVNQYLARFREMIEAGLNCKIVWAERMVIGNYQQMYETIEWLGLKWNSEVLNFVDPRLWRVRERLENGNIQK